MVFVVEGGKKLQAQHQKGELSSEKPANCVTLLRKCLGLVVAQFELADEQMWKTISEERTLQAAVRCY